MSEILLNQILTELKSTNKRLEQLDAGQINLETGQKKLEDGLFSLEASQKKLEDGLFSLEASQKELENGQKHFDNEIQSVKQAVIETNVTVQNIETEQQSIKQAVLETNESVKHLEAIQEQQHRIIEMLSARSLDHEGILRRIK